MRITLENMEQLKLGMEKLLDDESTNGTKHDALDRVLKTLGFRLTDEFEEGSNYLELSHVRQIWIIQHLNRAVKRWLEIQFDTIRYGWRDNEGAAMHRRVIDRELPKLQRALFETALRTGKVYDK